MVQSWQMWSRKWLEIGLLDLRAVKTMAHMENRDRYRGWHAVCLIKPPSPLAADMSIQGLARCVPYQAPLPTRYRGWHAVYLIKPPSPLAAWRIGTDTGTGTLCASSSPLPTRGRHVQPSWHWWCHNPSQTPLHVMCRQPRTWVFYAEGDKCRFGFYTALGTKVCSNESPWAMHLEVGVLPESIFGLMTLCRWRH